MITDDERWHGATLPAATILYTFTFSPPVNGFTVADVDVVGGTKAAAFASGADGSSVFTLEITPNAGFQGNLTVDVAAGVATDAAGNPNTAAPQSVQAVDTLAPSVVITDDEAGTANIAGGTIIYTFTFSQPVNGFAVADVVVVGGTKAAAFASGADGSSVYTLVITPNAGFQGILTVDVAAGVATDLAGNPNTAAPQSVQAVDTLAPSVVITDDEAGTANIAGGTITYTFTFSQSVNGFAVDDVVVVGGTKAAAFASGVDGSSVYTLVITPNAGFQGNLTVNVAAGVATDLAGNPNTAAPQSVQAVDTLAPSVVITDDEAGTANIAGGTITYTFTFSQSVNGFAVDDVVVVGGTKAAAFASGADGSSVYTLVITPNAGFQGNLTVDVAAGVATDLAGNPNTAAPQSMQPVDTLAPSVAITDDEAGTANIAGGTILYTFTFSQSVNGFAVADVVVVGGTKAAAFASGADGSSVYTLVITPNAGFQGNLTVDVAAGVATDLAGNPNTAAPQSVQPVDTLAPSVVITDDEAGTANIAGGTIIYTFTFSQPVNGFAVADVVVAGGTKAAAFASGADGSSVYTLVITPNAGFQGNLTVDVAAGVATDLAGNPNTAAPQSVQPVDTLAPSRCDHR